MGFPVFIINVPVEAQAGEESAETAETESKVLRLMTVTADGDPGPSQFPVPPEDLPVGVGILHPVFPPRGVYFQTFSLRDDPVKDRIDHLPVIFIKKRGLGMGLIAADVVQVGHGLVIPEDIQVGQHDVKVMTDGLFRVIPGSEIGTVIGVQPVHHMGGMDDVVITAAVLFIKLPAGIRQMGLDTQFHSVEQLDPAPVFIFQPLVFLFVSIEIRTESDRVFRVRKIRVIMLGKTHGFQTGSDPGQDHFFHGRVGVRGKRRVKMCVGFYHECPPS